MVVLVTPLAGVWIETFTENSLQISFIVTPLAGVWIETLPLPAASPLPLVTPLAGVWIETVIRCRVFAGGRGHSPCGSVD